MAFKNSRDPRNSKPLRKNKKWVSPYTDASSASEISMSDSDQDDVRWNRKSSKALGKSNGKKWKVELGSDEDEAQDFEDTPLLLIGFERLRNKKVNLKFYTDVLDKVLKPLAEDLPLCTINIIGPASLGKSFAINYIIKKLEAIQNQERNWMGWNTGHNSFNGFPVGKNESVSNQGIYIWSQPIVINTENRRVAVLVTETNGLHDDTFDSQEALTSILCLSLLTSSIVIYNTCESQLTEDSFLPLIPYIRFGKKIHESFAPNQEPPFQMLSFLIRDWDNQTEYCCGASDGKKLLQDKLLSNLDDKTAKTISKCMKEYFKSVDCFLLPPAGDMVSTEDFNGCPDQLDSEFAKKLEKYINTLVSPTNLPAKQIYETRINSYNFKLFLQAYIQLLNSYNKGTKKLSGTALHLVSTETLAECTLAKAMQEYRNAWENVQNEARYMEVRNMHQFHLAAKHKAHLYLNTSMIHMWYREVEELMRKLSSKINDEYKGFKQRNDDLRNKYISECLTEFLENYKVGLQSKVRLQEDENFYEDDYIKAASAEAVNEGMNQFKESFSDEGDEGRAEIRRMLNEQTSRIVNNLLEQNTLNRQRAEGKIMKHTEESIDNYKVFMEQLTTGANLDGLALGKMHNHLRKQAVDNFKASVFPGTKPFQEKFLQNLTASIDTLFETFQTGEQTKLEEQQLEACTLLKTARREYENELLDNTVISMSRKELDDLHTQVASGLMDKYKTKNPYPHGGSNYLNFELSMQQELESAKHKFLLNHVEEKRKLAENYQKAQEHSINTYINEMDKTMREGCMPESELKTLHENVHFLALNTFNEMTENSEDARQQRVELENRITDMFSNLKISNNQSFQAKTVAAETLLSEAQQQYVARMESGIYKNRQQFEGAHQKYVDDYEKMLSEKLKDDDELKESLIKKFGNFVSQTFNSMVGNIEVKMKKERLTLFKLLQDVQVLYHDEMIKQSKGRNFSSLNALEQLHRKISVSAITQCSRLSKITLTTEQRQRLVLAMEDSFCRYKLDYTMNKSNQTDNPAIGIDLGTTYCCVAVWQDKKIKVIPSHVGEETTPSYVAFEEDGSHVIGHTAKEKAFQNPENTIFDAKRMIGRRMADPILQNDIKYWPFTVIEYNGVPQIDIRGKPHPPERVSATLLANLKAEAEQFLDTKVTKAVITVPAYFDDGQRAATVDAGEMAGLEVLTILNEPTAAAIAYKMEQFSDTPRKVLVYDLGGGTFDVAVLQTGAKSIDVLGVDGDTHLGGEDFDKNLMEECVRQFKQQTGINLLQDKDSNVKQKKEQCRRILRRLQTYSEKAKRHLSSALHATITVDQIVPEKDLNVVITRAKFEELNQTLFKKTIDVVDKALKDAKVSKDKINDILLVGGSTRIPKIREMLSQHFNGKTLSHSVHPDIAVAYGAAVQAALLNGAKGESLFDFESIRDVTPMALGVEARIGSVSGRFSTIIQKNTKIPYKAVEKYYTTYKNQPSVEINVYQGENPVAKKNNFLGTFDLDGIPPNAAGAESLDVTMEIDKMGILHVTAVCDSTNTSNSITVQAKKGRLTEEEKKEISTAIQAQTKKHDKVEPSNTEDDHSNDDWFMKSGGGKESGSNFDLSSDEQDF